MTTATEPRAASAAAGAPLLQGRRIVVTGVLTHRSLAYAAATRMQELGAELVLTSFGRARRLTERAARTLPGPADVLELDVNRPEDLRALAAELEQRWEAVDGLFHSIAYGPPELWEGSFFDAPYESLDVAMRTSVYSLSTLAGALLPQMSLSPGGGSIVALTVMTGRHSVDYAWMGVMKTALDAVVKQVAIEVAPQRVRSNALAMGPLRTNAASGIPGFEQLEAQYQERAPLGWDSRDIDVVAGPASFLLSEHSRGITGEVINVDGGYHVLL
jgi:enoyl-[acyl-carrier protein] reductase I